MTISQTCFLPIPWWTSHLHASFRCSRVAKSRVGKTHCKVYSTLAEWTLLDLFSTVVIMQTFGKTSTVYPFQNRSSKGTTDECAAMSRLPSTPLAIPPRICSLPAIPSEFHSTYRHTASIDTSISLYFIALCKEWAQPFQPSPSQTFHLHLISLRHPSSQSWRAWLGSCAHWLTRGCRSTTRNLVSSRKLRISKDSSLEWFAQLAVFIRCCHWAST